MHFQFFSIWKLILNYLLCTVEERKKANAQKNHQGIFHASYLPFKCTYLHYIATDLVLY